MAKLNQAGPCIPAPSCPVCGYTAEDSAMWLDHHLCTGTIPGKQVPAQGDTNERAIKVTTRCELLQDVPDMVFDTAMRMLERMRVAHPQYKDDELLLKCLCASLIREAEVLHDRLRGKV